MEKVFYSVTVLLLFTACGRKQYFNSSPEIDIVKRASDAYYEGDWGGLKSIFNDTARIWFNTPRKQKYKLNTDQYIEAMKADLVNFSEYKPGRDPDFPNPVYEMIVDNEGNKWVHVWMTWVGKTKNGHSVVSPLHISSQVKNDKIALHFVYFNALPAYLALQQPDSTVSMNK